MQVAKCKERSLTEAAMNGHSVIWPEAKVTFKNGWAYFRRLGLEVWSCNEDYARLHFIIKEVSHPKEGA